MNLLFIDSDILLDIILLRGTFYGSAMKVLSLDQLGNYSFCTSVHTLLNVHYLAKKNCWRKSSERGRKTFSQKTSNNYRRQINSRKSNKI